MNAGLRPAPGRGEHQGRASARPARLDLGLSTPLVRKRLGLPRPAFSPFARCGARGEWCPTEKYLWRRGVPWRGITGADGRRAIRPRGRVRRPAPRPVALRPASWGRPWRRRPWPGAARGRRWRSRPAPPAPRCLPAGRIGDLEHRLVLVRIELLAVGLDRLDAVLGSSRCISRSVISMPSISDLTLASASLAGLGGQHHQGAAQRIRWPSACRGQSRRWRRSGYRRSRARALAQVFHLGGEAQQTVA